MTDRAPGSVLDGRPSRWHDSRNEVAVQSRNDGASRAYSWNHGSSGAKEKREMRENLLCMKRWYRRTRGRARQTEGRQEMSVSHLAATAVKSRTIVIGAKLRSRACQNCQKHVL